MEAKPQTGPLPFALTTPVSQDWEVFGLFEASDVDLVEFVEPMRRDAEMKLKAGERPAQPALVGGDGRDLKYLYIVT